MSKDTPKYGVTAIYEAPELKVKIKKLHPDAKIPTKATPQSVGYDLYVMKDICIESPRQVIPLGFAIELPVGVEAKIEPRSGFSSKGVEGFELKLGRGELWQRIDTPNRFNADVIVGKIDPDYRGEVGVIIRNNEPNKPFIIAKGTRIAQMTFYHIAQFPGGFEVTDELTETKRANGGFGHTGV